MKAGTKVPAFFCTKEDGNEVNVLCLDSCASDFRDRPLKLRTFLSERGCPLKLRDRFSFRGAVAALGDNGSGSTTISFVNPA